MHASDRFLHRYGTLLQTNRLKCVQSDAKQTLKLSIEQTERLMKRFKVMTLRPLLFHSFHLSCLCALTSQRVHVVCAHTQELDKNKDKKIDFEEVISQPVHRMRAPQHVSPNL